MACRKLIPDLCLNIGQCPALSILQLPSSHICCLLPSMLHSKPLGTFSKARCTSRTRVEPLSIKEKNSCLPKHVRVTSPPFPPQGKPVLNWHVKSAWGDFHLVYPHLPSSRSATDFPVVETSICHTVIEVMKKPNKPGISQALHEE